jgi:arylsulfatase
MTKTTDHAFNRRSILLGSTTLAAASTFSTGASIQVAQAQQPPPPNTAHSPNILFILMDNLGYGEPGVYGGGITRGAPTPRIDRLAAEGTRLTNFNVEAQCTPSRSAIMTGRFSIRSGTHSVPIGEGLEGLTQWEVTIAKLLSGAGYATAAFGKWHLGSTDGRLPNDQGFGEWYGIPRTTDEAFWPSETAARAADVPFEQIMEGRKGEKTRALGAYDLIQRRLIDAEITRRTIDFMKRSVNAGKPFYAYVPFTQVHFPTLPNPAFAGKTGFGDFPDALAEMDAHVGEILDAIDALNIRNNTHRWCSPATTVRKRRGRGKARQDRGAAIISRTWKVRCGCPSSSVGQIEFLPGASATRSCTSSIPSRHWLRLQAPLSQRIAPLMASTRATSCSARRKRPIGKASLCTWRIVLKPSNGGIGKSLFYDEQRDWWTPPTKLGTPKAFDLITDPKEEYPATGLRSTWVAAPAMRIVAELEKSLKKYPPIAPGTPDPYRPPS